MKNIKQIVTEHLEKTPPCNSITCEPIDPNTPEDSPLVPSGCQGCGNLFSSQDILEIDYVGSVCYSCQHNIAALVLGEWGSKHTLA